MRSLLLFLPTSPIAWLAAAPQTETLMNDRHYRLSIAWQTVGYNQPPHTSFDLNSRAVK